MNFDDAFTALIGNEGGYSKNPADPGGETKFGISHRAYPGEDIANMTLARAKEIYARDYWGPAGCDAVADGLKFQLFDMAVNSGVRPAIQALQHAAGATADGVLGPATLQLLQSIPAPRLVARFNGYRLDLLADLNTWPAFSRGWAKRIASNLKLA